MAARGEKEHVIRPKPVYLISADIPGCGSTTLSNGIRDNVGSPDETYIDGVGDAVRRMLGVRTEEDFQGRMNDVPDPAVFDEQFYTGLPDDKVCIIDGKLATAIGPRYVDSKSRDITAIDLTSTVLFSAKRILGREDGIRFPEIFHDEDRARKLLARYSMVKERVAHDNTMRLDNGIINPWFEGVSHHRIDTSKTSKEETLGVVLGIDHTQTVPGWEIEGLVQAAEDIADSHAALGSRLHAADLVHFGHQREGVQYKTERLSLMLDPRGIETVRLDLKKTLTDAWSSIMMKNSPRFFRVASGEVVIDDKSHAWTPEFYKIAEAWPIMTRMLKGKTILDPFAGAGTLANLLASRGIPSKIFVSDIAYEGGEPLDKDGGIYATDLNRQMYEILFDDLPSWYKPDHSAIQPPITADVRNIPLNDKSVDYVVTDPPYDKNHKGGGVELLMSALCEMTRVAKRGCILLVPENWLPILEKEGYNIRQMTKDVSNGISGFPTCYIFIDSNKLMKKKAR